MVKDGKDGILGKISNNLHTYNIYFNQNSNALDRFESKWLFLLERRPAYTPPPHPVGFSDTYFFR